ncbi:MAG: response regulator [Pseudomonadota bacterium]|nr:response regulator [Pseudomonadota bacterium]
MRILVIDEEAFVREALQRVLGRTSTVITASNAAEGLRLLRESPTDLVIIDVVLPAVDGIAAIREIRSEYPHVRVIAIAASGQSGVSSYRPEAISTNAYLAASTAAGAHGTLAKPFETSELRELIERICSPQAPM